MIIIMFDENGNVKKVPCNKVEPTVTRKGYLIVDEDYTIAIEDILAIVNK